MKIVYCLKTKKEIINVMIAPDESYIYIIAGEQNTPKQCNSKFENGEPVLALIGFKVFQKTTIISQFERYCEFINGTIYGDYAVFDINNQKINSFLEYDKIIMNSEMIPKTPLTQQPAKKELVKQILALITIDLNEDCTHNKSRMPKMRLKRVSIDILQKALQYAINYYNTNQTKTSFIKLGSFIDIQNRKKILDNMF